MSTPPLCPRCGLRPSNRTYRLRPVFCRECARDVRMRRWRQRAASARKAETIDDIPAADIERRYQAALAQIRRQRWTSAQRS